MVQTPPSTSPLKDLRTPLEWVTGILLIVGGLNWAVIGFFGLDVVAAVFGPASSIPRTIYDLVGLAALYWVIRMVVPVRRTHTITK